MKGMHRGFYGIETCNQGPLRLGGDAVPQLDEFLGLSLKFAICTVRLSLSFKALRGVILGQPFGSHV